MVGYQGWFRTPNDGSGLGWAHYAEGARAPAFGNHLDIDYWPDVSELPAASRVDTPLHNADGSPAQVFSSQDPAVTDLHFRWMREYGIDGAYVQRFAAPIIFPDARSRGKLRSNDVVLRHALAAAEKYGRAVAVMYDLSGMPAQAMDRVKADWRHLVDDLKLRKSSAYQFHRERPVVAVWGVGFNDHRKYTLAECADLIEFLKNDPVYGGNTVVVGVPTAWRELSGDAVSDPDLLRVIPLADVVSPWTPGRYADLDAVRRHFAERWEPDLAWCAAHHLDYLPVVFPGFSWRNLKGVDTSIDRLEGRFLWEQYQLLANHGFTMVYQAMFDEMNEGTQIMKTASVPPIDARFASYAPLPPDFYLRLVGDAANYFHHSKPMVARVVPNALDVGPRSAPLNALGTTRATSSDSP